MTPLERVQAVADYGFTEREARFLVLVMRHAGLCVKRQYAAFAGIANGGDRCHALFDKLTRRGFVVAVNCIHNRARLYHVHHKPLYYAIGEPDNRYRRTVSARAAAERLMRLDAALLSPELDWLTTRSEKVAYLTQRSASGSSEPSAALPTQDRLDLCPGTFPIGVDPMGRAVVVYVATRPWTDDFRSFLAGHVPLLAVTPTWTLRLVFPSSLARVVPDYRGAVHEQLRVGSTRRRSTTSSGTSFTRAVGPIGASTPAPAPMPSRRDSRAAGLRSPDHGSLGCIDSGRPRVTPR